MPPPASVKQLRTNLLDAEVWEPLLKLIKTDDDELVRTSSRTLCNLLLDFSPSKVETLGIIPFYLSAVT